MKTLINSEAIKSKHELDLVEYPDKECKWCGAILVRTRQSLSEWKRKTTCGGSCSMNFFRQGCSKVELPVEEDKYCETCQTLLVRRLNESNMAWKKRVTCNKSCATTGKVQKRIKPIATDTPAKKQSDVKIYVRGTPEFKAIAAQYGG